MPPKKEENPKKEKNPKNEVKQIGRPPTKSLSALHAMEILKKTLRKVIDIERPTLDEFMVSDLLVRLEPPISEEKSTPIPTIPIEDELVYHTTHTDSESEIMYGPPTRKGKERATKIEREIGSESESESESESDIDIDIERKRPSSSSSKGKERASTVGTEYDPELLRLATIAAKTPREIKKLAIQLKGIKNISENIDYILGVIREKTEEGKPIFIKNRVLELMKESPELAEEIEKDIDMAFMKGEIPREYYNILKSSIPEDLKNITIKKVKMSKTYPSTKFMTKQVKEKIKERKQTKNQQNNKRIKFI